MCVVRKSRKRVRSIADSLLADKQVVPVSTCCWAVAGSPPATMSIGDRGPGECLEHVTEANLSKNHGSDARVAHLGDEPRAAVVRDCVPRPAPAIGGRYDSASEGTRTSSARTGPTG